MAKKSYKKFKITYRKPTASYKKIIIKDCVQGFCNPGCKGTIYEPGESLSENLVNDIKKLIKDKKTHPSLLKAFKKMRKTIFKNKKNVLKDGFYEKFNVTQKKRYQKHGALSGCSLSMKP